MSKSIPPDVKLITKSIFIDGFNEVISKLGTRVGPHIMYFNEQANDTKIREFKRDFSDGIGTINQVLSDCTSGMVIIAGRANAGKSTFLTALEVGALRNNPDTLVVDISLDDPIKKRYQQLICCMSGLRYTEVANPSLLTDSQLARRDAAQKELYQWIEDERFYPLQALQKISEERYLKIRDYKHILYFAKYIRDLNPDKKIIFTIDAWNNIDYSSAGSGTEKMLTDGMLGELKACFEQNEIIAFISAHLRKTKEKRVDIQDVKGTSDLEYHATVTLIVRNELKENQLVEPLMFDHEGRELPVLVLECPKNKGSEWTSNLYYPLDSSRNTLLMPSPQDYKALHTTYIGKRR
jgi:hypothetical protein